MKPEHLALLRVPGRPTVDPTGEYAVAAVARPDLDEDAYRSRLWRFPLSGAPAWPLTAGESDSQPVLSPDGRRLAFLRRVDGRAQLAVLDTRGGEPRVLTAHRLGVEGRPVWSPDSTRLAYVARVPEEGRFSTRDGVGPEAEPARRITRFTYRSDGVGFTIGRPTHVHVLDVPRTARPVDGAPEPVRPLRLTDGELAVIDPVWTPDGAALLALRARADRLGADLVRLALPEPGQPDGRPDGRPDGEASDDEEAARDGVLVPVRPVVVELPGTLVADAVTFGPDAPDVLHLLVSDLGPDALGFVGTNSALARGRLDGGTLTDVRVLTDPLLDDLAGGTGDGTFQVLPGSADAPVLLRRVRRGRTELVLARPTTAEGAGGGEAVLDVVHPGSITGATALADGRLVASATLVDSPGELLLLEPATLDASAPDGETRLTDLGAPLRVVAPARVPVVVPATSADGEPVHGWLATPDPAVHGEGPYPTLLLIHGGPYAAYEDTFFDEVQVYTGAGYAVVYGNPRGSAGYGAAHGRAIVEGFGTVDADDVLALLDAALARHTELDATRVGVLGGSYGGYMTAWLTTRPDARERFRAAIVERGFLDPVSFEGSSDIGWFFGLRYLGEDADRVAAQSPMARIGDVVTPTLVIHSEQDWRCPVEQGQRWFVGLKRRGVEAELLLFPGEGHELSRSGRPAHRRQRFEAILDWWSRYLA